MRTARFFSRSLAFWFAAMAAALAALFVWMTARGLEALPERLNPLDSGVRKVQVLDRTGAPLSITYSNEWNVHDYVPVLDIPATLQRAFIASEDRRFYEHGGVDWLARLHALVQNIRALRAVRGASTITEQTVRLIHPRPRTVWSRWLEGIEARRLEGKFSKAEIFEFYLNEVPYAHQRRGVVQASRLYFNRDLDTLNLREILALAVLVRAPSSLDPRNGARALDKGVTGLAKEMHRRGDINESELGAVKRGDWRIEEFRLPVDAGHFVQRVYKNGRIPTSVPGGKLFTTLDGSLQGRLQKILDRRLDDLKGSDVSDGAILAVDHQTDEILAWVNAGGISSGKRGAWIDAVIAPRQPGSTLKPFLYALALDKGWTPATIIEDAPLIQAVGTGLHNFRNYSRRFYGPLRLRDTLGNSLNTPAVRTVQFTGPERFLDKLHELGFQSLNRSAECYGEGLALGDGEVALFELVQAYAALARGGAFRPLRMTPSEGGRPPDVSRRVFTEETASVIGDILSDPQARRLEFGEGHLLRFPVQTAVKTGTSSDHKDTLAVGFSHRYVVGVWMGNLDRRPTNGLTGAAGPALVLRAAFAELNRYGDSGALRLSPGLVSVGICRESGMLPGPDCPVMREWFKRGSEPQGYCSIHCRSCGRTAENRSSPAGDDGDIRLVQPTQGLKLAMDPRIPDELEAFELMLPKRLEVAKVEWIVDGKVAGTTAGGQHGFVWPLTRGSHQAEARVWRAEGQEPASTPVVSFTVK